MIELVELSSGNCEQKISQNVVTNGLSTPATVVENQAVNIPWDLRI